MAYASWSVVFGEQPSAAKWNILGTNDASFNDGTGIGNATITAAKRTGGFYVGTFTPSVTGSLAVSGVGFTPSAILVGRQGSSGTSVAMMFSFCTASSQQVISFTGGGAGANLNTEDADSLVINHEGSTGTATCKATLTSMDADGFTLNVSIAENIPYMYLAMR